MIHIGKSGTAIAGATVLGAAAFFSSSLRRDAYSSAPQVASSSSIQDNTLSSNSLAVTSDPPQNHNVSAARMLVDDLNRLRSELSEVRGQIANELDRVEDMHGRINELTTESKRQTIATSELTNATQQALDIHVSGEFERALLKTRTTIAQQLLPYSLPVPLLNPMIDYTTDLLLIEAAHEIETNPEKKADLQAMTARLRALSLEEILEQYGPPVPNNEGISTSSRAVIVTLSTLSTKKVLTWLKDGASDLLIAAGVVELIDDAIEMTKQAFRDTGELNLEDVASRAKENGVPFIKQLENDCIKIKDSTGNVPEACKGISDAKGGQPTQTKDNSTKEKSDE